MGRHPPKLRTVQTIGVRDFSKICRFCMNHSETLKPIFKDDLYDDGSEMEADQSITKMFVDCLNIAIDPEAQLPLFICPGCTGKLEECCDFRKQCLQSQRRLTEIWQEEQNGSGSQIHYDVGGFMNEDTDASMESKIKEEDSDNDNDTTMLDEIDLRFGDRDKETSVDSSNNSNDKVHSRKPKKSVGRPKKATEEKGEKAQSMCQICGGLYVSLKYHMFVHEVPKFECDYCGKKFKHKGNLFAHVRIHANDRKHSCPHCPYKFQERAKYLRHLKIHTGERNINCDICSKSFRRKTDMLKHRLTHDVPRVPCPHCDKMFTTRTNMLSHVGIHTGERNFKCETCGAAFTASSSLSNHRKIHKKENPVLKCKECGIVLADMAMLKNHMRDHQNIVMME